MWWRFVLIKPIGLWMARKEKYNLKYEGAENAPGYGPCIVVANHQTKVDVFATGLAIRKTISRCRLVPWGKVEIGQRKEGFLGWLLWHWLGTIPINRETPGEMEEAIRKSLEHLRRGHLVFIHPEGTRFPYGELGPFKYGVANLARAAPAPILPVGVWRRRSDNGIQVRIGKPFFMPPRNSGLERLSEAEAAAEERLAHQVELLKRWGDRIPRDRKGMRMFASMVDSVVKRVSTQQVRFDHFCRLAEKEDNEFLRDRILELLPSDFRKVDTSSKGVRHQNFNLPSL